MTSTRGGKRAGAGRPRTAAALAKDDELVVRKLRSAADAGFEVLADAYPDLMRLAVRGAKGGEKSGPNWTMLRGLLDLMIKIVGTEPEPGETPMTRIVEKFLDRLSEDVGDSSGPDVAGDRGGRHGLVNSRDVTGAKAYPAVPGVERSIRIPGND